MRYESGMEKRCPNGRGPGIGKKTRYKSDVREHWSWTYPQLKKSNDTKTSNLPAPLIKPCIYQSGHSIIHLAKEHREESSKKTEPSAPYIVLANSDNGELTLLLERMKETVLALHTVILFFSILSLSQE